MISQLLIFSCCELYDNKPASQSTQTSTLKHKVNPPEGGFSWLLLHDLKQPGQQTSFPITDKTPRACEDITAWVEGLPSTDLVKHWNPVSCPELLIITIPVLDTQYKYSLTFITSSTSGRILLTVLGESLQYLQHDFQINPKQKLITFSQNFNDFRMREMRNSAGWKKLFTRLIRFLSACSWWILPPKHLLLFKQRQKATPA